VDPRSLRRTEYGSSKWGPRPECASSLSPIPSRPTPVETQTANRGSRHDQAACCAYCPFSDRRHRRGHRASAAGARLQRAKLLRDYHDQGPCCPYCAFSDRRQCRGRPPSGASPRLQLGQLLTPNVSTLTKSSHHDLARGDRRGDGFADSIVGRAELGEIVSAGCSHGNTTPGKENSRR
jgi:hypothetical protein